MQKPQGERAQKYLGNAPESANEPFPGWLGDMFRAMRHLFMALLLGLTLAHAQGTDLEEWITQAKGSKVKRTHSYEVIQNNLIHPSVFPFLPGT